jgi:hypothetical protein
MRPPSNGITAEVIRDCMKPYSLNPDLLEDTVNSLPPPPPDATPAWRHRRLSRLMQEVAIFMPADDGQAKLAAQAVGLRELAGRLQRECHAPGVSVVELCRLSRCAADGGGADAAGRWFRWGDGGRAGGRGMPKRCR